MPATKTPMRKLAAKAQTWPTVAELADESGIHERMIRAYVQRGLVEAMRVDVTRINPDSWERFLESRYKPGQF